MTFGSRLICMQVESLGVNGLALAREGRAIGFRGIPLLPEHGRFDGKLVLCTLKEIGPHDSGDRYHHVSFQTPVTGPAVNRFLGQELFWGNSLVVPDFGPDGAALVRLEWTFDGRRALALFSADREVDFLLLFNGCVEPAAVESVEGSRGVLSQGGWQVGLACSSGTLVAESTLERLECLVRGLPLTPKPAGVKPAVAGIRLKLGPSSPVAVAMGEGPVEVPSPARVRQALDEGRRDMAPRLMRSAGAAADCADAIQRMVGFSAAYDVKSHRCFVPVNRDWAGPNSTPAVFMWDNFFDSYMACFHHPELARESLSQIIGIIRDRGMEGAPPQRNLIVPIVYSKTVRMIGDAAFTAETFPVMMRFMRFWFEDRGDGHPRRDGNDDGLIECGTCREPGDWHALGSIVQDAFDETGYDDSPMYSAGFGYERRGLFAEGVKYDFQRGTLNLTMVGQNALYVAACRAMAVLARELGASDDETWLCAEADRVGVLLRERLFDPAAGYFKNRFFDGSFSTVKTPDLFSPLLADAADADVQGRLRAMLLDPGQFWGDNILPTVSRDDPAYRDDTRRGEYWRGNYWRGNVWAPTNYIAYLSIRQAGWSGVAAEFAVKSRRLFMDDWLTRHHAHENYPPEGGTACSQFFTGNGGRDPHYIWAGLLPLIALEQLFSVEDVAAGVRFGTVEPASFGSWEGFLYQGRRARVSAGADGISLDVEGLFSFTSDKPLAVREFLWDGNKISFRYTAPVSVRVVLKQSGQKQEWQLPGGMGAI
jgi:hypothetical protein